MVVSRDAVSIPETLVSREDETGRYRGLAINREIRNQRKLVLLEPDESVRDALLFLLENENWDVIEVSGCEELKEVIERSAVLAIISEASLPGCSPDEILDYCSTRKLPVIFTGHDVPLQGAVDLIRKGAIDFLDKPFPQSRLLNLLDGLDNRQNK